MKPAQSPWLVAGRSASTLLCVSLDDADESQYIADGVYRPVAFGTELNMYDERLRVFRKLVNRSAP